MAVSTFEGSVIAGQIQLRNGVRLPENAVVFVVVPDYSEGTEFIVTIPTQPQIRSPRLSPNADPAHFAAVSRHTPTVRYTVSDGDTPTQA